MLLQYFASFAERFPIIRFNGRSAGRERGGNVPRAIEAGAGERLTREATADASREAERNADSALVLKWHRDRNDMLGARYLRRCTSCEHGLFI